MVPYGSIVYYHIVKSYVWRARSLAFEQFYTRYVIHFCMHLWVRVWVRMNVWEFQCQSSNLNINFASKFCGFVCSFVRFSLSLSQYLLISWSNELYCTIDDFLPQIAQHSCDVQCCAYATRSLVSAPFCIGICEEWAKNIFNILKWIHKNAAKMVLTSAIFLHSLTFYSLHTAYNFQYTVFVWCQRWTCE